MPYERYMFVFWLSNLHVLLVSLDKAFTLEIFSLIGYALFLVMRLKFQRTCYILDVYCFSI